MKIRLLMLLAICLSFSSCFFKTQKDKEELRFFEECKKKYGTQFNEERKKLGLMMIEEDWEADRRYNGNIYWHNPESPPLGKSGHDLKETILGKDFWREWDRYLGANMYYTLDSSKAREYVRIDYFTDDVKSGGHSYQKGFNCILFSSDVVNGILPDWISLEQADSILTSWGVERLNY